LPRLKFQTPRSHLGLETERLGLGLGLDTEGLGLGLGLGSKRLGLVGKHFSIMCIKLCLNMPLRFSLSSRLPPLLFRTTSVLGIMWMWDVASVLTPRAGLEAVSRRSSASARSRLGNWYASTSSLSQAVKALILGLASA